MAQLIPESDIYVLATYKDDPAEDGLSHVYHRVKSIGKIVQDSSGLSSGSIVLVPGLPRAFLDRISNENLNIAYTTYEFFPIPQDWVWAINEHYAAIIVPHEEIKTIFSNSGVSVPIHVVQQGYSRMPNVPEHHGDPTEIRVGFCGVPVVRKNLNLLIKAVERISQISPVKLYVHISKYYDNMPAESLRHYLSNHPLIIYTEGYKTLADLAMWYSSLSCYVFPSSGEGWSFTPRESLSLGVPTILSDIPVHRDLSAYTVMIDTPITITSIQTSLQTFISSIYYYQALAREGQRWIKNMYLDTTMVDDVRKTISTIVSSRSMNAVMTTVAATKAMTSEHTDNGKSKDITNKKLSNSTWTQWHLKDLRQVKNTEAYCITLTTPKNEPRREQFQKNALLHDWSVAFWEAEDCRHLSMRDYPAWIVEGAVRPDWHEPIKPGEVGNAWSHKKLYQYGVESDLDYLIVFEDDAIIIKEPIFNLPSDFDIVFFNDRFYHNEEGELWGVGCGTDGYIISQRGMRKSLRLMEGLNMPLDLTLMAHTRSLIMSDSYFSQFRRPNMPILDCYHIGPLSNHDGTFDSDVSPSNWQELVDEGQ